MKVGRQTQKNKVLTDPVITRFTATFQTVHISYKVERINRLTPLRTVLVTGLCYMPLAPSSNDGLIGSIQDQ